MVTKNKTMLCTTCGKNESTSYSYECKPCAAARQRQQRKNNPESFKRMEAKRKNRFRKIIADIKNVPCKDCGNSYPSFVMDFDHVRGTKDFTIARAMSGCIPLKRVLAEIAKCDIVCSNCHRIRTHGSKN